MKQRSRHSSARPAAAFAWTSLAVMAILIVADPLQAQKRVVPRSTPPAPSASTGNQLKGIWEPVNYPEDVELDDVFFVDPLEGWAAGGTTVMNGGILLHTSDGGDHWDVQLGDSKSSDRGMKDLRFIDATHGWVVQGAPLDAKLLHTTDGNALRGLRVHFGRSGRFRDGREDLRDA